MEKTPIFVVVGATASGKTKLSVELAKKIGGEIISADSMQIYKGMQIATAKPTTEEMSGINHYMIDFLGIDEDFSVAQFVKNSNEHIKNIIEKGKNPIVAGGTGLYIDSLINNIQFTENSVDETIRNKYIEFEKVNGRQALWEKLNEVDPDLAKNLHYNNVHRIIRALETFELTNTKMSVSQQTAKEIPSEYNFHIIGINYKNRQNLYDRINKRVDLMLEAGLLQEAKNVRGLFASSPTAKQAIGYKELEPYFKGEMELKDAVENLKMQTRRYAKRQLTWFRRNEKINWYYADEYENFEEMFSVILSDVEKIKAI